MNGICRVCELIDNNTTIKKVYYCKTCSNFICYICKRNILKRAKAALIELNLKRNA